MNAWSPHRARAGLLFSAVLVLIGLVPAAYFLGLLVWQLITSMQAGKWLALPMSLLFTGHSFAFLPQFPWPWFTSPDSLLPLHETMSWTLSRLHAGILAGLLGAALIAVGVLGVLKHYAALRFHRQRREDQARRVRDYRREDHHGDALGRREPFMVDTDPRFESAVRTKRRSARA